MLSGEVGKISVLVQHANYALDTTTITKATTLKNFYSGALATTFVNSIKSNRIPMTMLIDSARPANSEYNSLYTALSNLKGRYNDCCNFIESPGDANKFKASAESYINAFNSALASMGFDKFITSSYTTANKNQAYASMLRSSQTHINDSATALSNLLSTLMRLGDSRFKSSADIAIGNNASTYMDGAAAAGRLNAYRLMLLGASSSYSGSYSDVSAAYNSLASVIKYSAEALSHTLNEYSGVTNQAIASSRANASRISNAIAKAF